MADQALAQTGALKDPLGAPLKRKSMLRHELTWRWQMSRCWARYVLAGQYRGIPGLVDFIFGNRYFNACQVRSELTSLGELLAQRRPERALEIGTARGGTLLFLTRLASPRATIVSVDLPGGEFGSGYGNRRRWFYQRFSRREQVLRLLQDDSHSTETLEKVKAEFSGQPVDYLFIDGDHSYEGVRRDFEMYSPIVARGGLIAFHDIVEGAFDCVGGVPQFWNEIKSQYRHDEFIEDPKQGGYGIGVIYWD